MNKYIWLIICILCIDLALAGYTLPDNAEAGSIISVVYDVPGTVQGEKAVIGEQLSGGATIGKWDFSDATDVEYVKAGNDYVWEFTAGANPVLTYEVQLPEDGEEIGFDMVYALPPTRFGRDQDSLRLTVLTAQVIDEPQVQEPVPEVFEEPQKQPFPFVRLMIILAGIGMMTLAVSMKHQQHAHEKQEKKIQIKPELYVDEPIHEEAPKSQTEIQELNQQMYDDHHGTEEEYEKPWEKAFQVDDFSGTYGK